MKPLSKNVRRTYLVLLILLFVVLVPVTVLYSAGYRVGEHFTIVKTGGIYIGLNEPGARLFLNGKFIKRASILKNGFFLQDLTPRVYHVAVEKDGFLKWEKVLEVKPQHVVEASAFILPQEVPLEDILPVSAERNGSVGNQEYVSIQALFATSTTATSISLYDIPGIFATSTQGRRITDIKKKGDIVLWREGDGVFARWVSDRGNAPSYFCEGLRCDKEIRINKTSIDFFDFYPNSNELVVIKTPEGIHVTEIDPRIPRNIKPLYLGKDARVRVLGDAIFITGEERLFRVAL
ncbi:MAG: hypothetical protein HYT29_00610 [Parcubacteria group bacterium]|nr:hypothetical protein [Parcubacteria group bacterium]MBI2618203.1 hypothetical protein [Candidatus Kaiserbacteria bacterium]